jgi:hypothetical protein
MKSKIFYDDETEIIESYTFIHYDMDKAVTFSIKEDDGTKINIRLEFIYDKNIKGENFNFTEYNSDTLKITVTHNGQLMNYGYVKPLKIGSFNNHNLYFNIRVDLNTLQDSPLINYTFYKGKKNNI